MKSLIFLLILDFSGSMYQNVHNEKKFIVLKQNVRAFNQSLESDILAKQSGILTFGLNPKKKCNDIIYSETSNTNLANEVDKLFPGAFSKTPLGESISRGTDITIENKVQKVIIFSDGADTCGKDPCKELVKANDKLVKANYIMDIKFIGLNLDDNDPKFACFRNNTLSNIRIDYSNIKDGYEIQNELKKEQKLQPKDIKSPFGLLEVKGAPPGVKFSLIDFKKEKGIDSFWYGNFKKKLKEGRYTIKAHMANTQVVKTYVTKEDLRSIYWEDFFKNSISEVKLKNVFTVLLTPSAQTIEAHRTVSATLVEGFIEANEQILHIPFGEWKVEMISPVWVKNNSSSGFFEAKPMQSNKLTLEKYFQVDWVTPPYPELRWVFELQKDKEKEKLLSLQKAKESLDESLDQPLSKEVDDKIQRYYLQAPMYKVPIPDGYKVEWIQPGPQK